MSSTGCPGGRDGETSERRALRKQGNMNAGETADTVAKSPVYWGALGCYIGLILLLLAWMTWLSPPPPALITPLLLVFGLPLLLGLRGVIHRRRYTLQWTGMLVLAYAIHGMVAVAGEPPARWLGTAEVLLTAGYFTASMLVLRPGKRAMKAQKAQS